MKIIIGLRFSDSTKWPQYQLLGIEYSKFADSTKLIVGYWFGKKEFYREA